MCIYYLGYFLLTYLNFDVPEHGSFRYFFAFCGFIFIKNYLFLNCLGNGLVNYVRLIKFSKPAKMFYSWLAKCVEVVDKKLNVVIRPVRVVQYCKHPFGGLKISRICKASVCGHL